MPEMLCQSGHVVIAAGHGIPLGLLAASPAEPWVSVCGMLAVVEYVLREGRVRRGLKYR